MSGDAAGGQLQPLSGRLREGSCFHHETISESHGIHQVFAWASAYGDNRDMSSREEGAMKPLIPVVAAVVGLATIGAAQAAHPETYEVNVGLGYAMLAYVGNTPAEYTEAQRLAKLWEGRRHLGLGPQSVVARAIDNTEGTAKQQIRRLGLPDNAVQYVYVH